MGHGNPHYYVQTVHKSKYHNERQIGINVLVYSATDTNTLEQSAIQNDILHFLLQY